jgi:hypothetical protein
MAVRTEAEQRYVEEWTHRIENRRTIGLLQSSFVPPSGVLQGSVSWDGVNANYKSAALQLSYAGKNAAHISARRRLEQVANVRSVSAS